MIASHTPGRLKVQHPHEGERGWEIAFEPGLEQVCQNITEANARRLVACWNLLENVPTERIEASTDYGSSWGKCGHELAAMTVQRDELLAALKLLMEMLDDEIKTSTDEQLAFGLSDPACPEHIKSELNCVIACRAAIAKAGGEA